MEKLDVSGLMDDLILDEGLRLKPYRCTAGKLTIGIGRNIEDNGITKVEALYMLSNDISGVTGDMDRNIPWWRDMHADAQRALVNMAFNLGIVRLLKFKKMLNALEGGLYDLAAHEAIKNSAGDGPSKWKIDVGDARANRIAALFRSV
jgi:lysozyme